MGKFIQKRDRIIADAIKREAALVAILHSATDETTLMQTSGELAQIRRTKTEAKLVPDDEFECALHHEAGKPAAFKSAARVLLEVSAAFVYAPESEKPETAHLFRKRPSYLVICLGCAASYRIIENLTDEIEEK